MPPCISIPAQVQTPSRTSQVPVETFVTPKTVRSMLGATPTVTSSSIPADAFWRARTREQELPTAASGTTSTGMSTSIIFGSGEDQQREALAPASSFTTLQSAADQLLNLDA